MVKELIQGETYTQVEIDDFFQTEEEKIKEKYELEDKERIEIEFNDGIVGTTDSSFYNVKEISIDLDAKTIDVNDDHGIIGLIHYKESDEVVLHDHDENGTLMEKAKWIVLNKKLLL